MLLSKWYANRRAKGAVNTKDAIRLNLEKINDLADQSGMTIEEYLEEVIRLGWATFHPVKSEQARPKKAASKQSVFDSDASYDIGEFEKNIVGMKYLDKE